MQVSNRELLYSSVHGWLDGTCEEGEIIIIQVGYMI